MTLKLRGGKSLIKQFGGLTAGRRWQHTPAGGARSPRERATRPYSIPGLLTPPLCTVVLSWHGLEAVSSWSLPSISHLATLSTGCSGVGLPVGVLPCVESPLPVPSPALFPLLRLLCVLKSSQSLPCAVIAFGSVTTKVRFQNKSTHTPSVHNVQ